MTVRFINCAVSVALLCLVLRQDVLAQEQPIRQLLAVQISEEARAEDDSTSNPVDETVDAEAVSTRDLNSITSDPGQIRLHLRDGSVIAGELSVEAITVKTEFGELKVPVENIKRFDPGLDSYPDLSARITGLFDDLGSDNYQKREQAHKELVKYGLRIQNELDRYVGEDNAELTRHLAEIRKELAELAEEAEEFEDQEALEKPWIRGDTIVTTEFTMVGRIAEESFTITSKYGPLTVKLSDVQMADRTVGEKAEVRRSLSVDGNHLVQRSFKSSGIRVEKGDKITVRAEGQITMTPWGGNHSSTPDGGVYYGWYEQNQIPGGALVAKIGSNGQVLKVGSKSVFVAKSSGLLQFAIAMQHQYANQSYNYPGQYTLRVKVQP